MTCLALCLAGFAGFAAPAAAAPIAPLAGIDFDGTTRVGYYVGRAYMPSFPERRRSDSAATIQPGEEITEQGQRLLAVMETDQRRRLRALVQELAASDDGVCRHFRACAKEDLRLRASFSNGNLTFTCGEGRAASSYLLAAARVKEPIERSGFGLYFNDYVQTIVDAKGRDELREAAAQAGARDEWHRLFAHPRLDLALDEHAKELAAR